MQTVSDIGRLTLRDPILKWLFIRKEIGARKKTKTVAKHSEKSIFPYGDEYRKVQSFYRFVE